MRICTKAKEQKQLEKLRGATGCRKAMRSTYKRQLEYKESKSRLKYRCIATSKVRNEKDKKLEKTHCEVMLFSFEGMTSKEKIR